MIVNPRSDAEVAQEMQRMQEWRDKDFKRRFVGIWKAYARCADPDAGLPKVEISSKQAGVIRFLEDGTGTVTRKRLLGHAQEVFVWGCAQGFHERGHYDSATEITILSRGTAGHGVVHAFTRTSRGDVFFFEMRKTSVDEGEMRMYSSLAGNDQAVIYYRRDHDATSVI